MESFIDRLKTEKNDLITKIEKLESFIVSDKFFDIDEVQQSLLSVQLTSMKTYYVCLAERIKWIEK